MKTEELITNTELVNNLAESLEECPQDSAAKYDLWVVCHSCCGESTEELFIYEFDNPEEAVKKAEAINITFIEEQLEMSITDFCDDTNTDYFTVEVETVVNDPDDEDGGTMNIGTIYKRDIWLDGEYPEYEVGLDGDPIIALVDRDYEILDDNTIRIRSELLRGFNKNDEVHIYFADNKDSDILTCKVVACEDSYYYCELSI